MVAHFDAVCILLVHVDRIKFRDNSGEAYHQVIIKVINPPDLEKKSLPWKDLLENERYFDDGVMGSPSTSEIIMFLKQWKSQNDQPKTWTWTHINEIIKGLKEICSEDMVPDFDKTKTSMFTMWGCHSPNFESGLDDLLKTMKTFKDDKLELGLKPANLDKIIKKLQSLRDNALIFSRLGDQTFEGLLHCELSLACFIMCSTSNEPRDSECQAIVDELPVSCQCIISTLQFYHSYTLYRMLHVSMVS